MSKSSYSYMVVGILALLAVGWRSNISMFYHHLMNLYGIDSVTQVAAFVVISSGIGIFASSVFGALYDKKGPSTLLVVGAIAQLASGTLVLFMKSRPWSEAVWYWYLSAIAYGFVFSAVATSVNPAVISSLPSRPQLAIAAAQSGSYMALALWSPIITYLLTKTDPFYTFFTASLVTTSVTLLCAAAYRGIAPSKQRALEVRSDPASRRAYFTMLIPIFLVATSSIMVISYLAPIISEIYESSGVSSEEAMTVYTPAVIGVAGILQTAGGFFWGFIATRIGILKTVLALYVTQSASSYAVSIVSHASAWPAVLALLVRLFAFGGEPVVHMSIVPALFGNKNVGKLVGLQISVVMLSSIVGPALGGLTRDVTKTYLSTVASSALLTTAAIAFLLVASRVMRKYYLLKQLKQQRTQLGGSVSMSLSKTPNRGY